MSRTDRLPGTQYSGLVLNPRGLTRAIEAGMHEVNVVLVASETFSRRNQGAPIDGMIGRWHQIVAEANGSVPLSVTIAAAFGCPFEGEVDPDVVARLAGEAYDGGRWRSPWPTRSASACRPRFGGCSLGCPIRRARFARSAPSSVHNDDVYRGLPGLGEDEIASLAGNAVIQRSLTRCSGCRTRASVTFDPKGAKAIMVLSTLQADGYTQSR